MKKFISGLVSAAVCVCMLFTLLPCTPVYAEKEKISEIIIDGFKKPVAGENVKSLKLSSRNDKVICTNYNDRWSASIDDTNPNASHVFLEGTYYYYGIGLKFNNAEYELADNCDIRIYDGSKFYAIPPENIEVNGVSYDGYRYVYMKTTDFYTGGEEMEFLDEIKICGVQHPYYGQLKFDNVSSISVPEGVPYKIRSKSYYCSFASQTPYFDQDDTYKLDIDLEFDKGYGMHKNTKIVFDDASTFSPYRTYVSTSAYTYSNDDFIRGGIDFYFKIRFPESKTVTFDANGGTFGSGVTTMKAVAGTDGRIADFPGTVTRKGFNFAGWYTDPTDGDKIELDRVYESDKTVYAHWEEVLTEVRMDNVVMPMHGRAPVFSSIIPNDAEYEVTFEKWEWDDSDSGKVYTCTSVPYMNEYADSQGLLLEEFDAANTYKYSVTFKATGGKPFVQDTVFYINGNKIDSGIGSDGGTVNEISLSFDMFVSEKSFIVYNGSPVTIPSGITGEAITPVDLKNYISAPDGFTISTPEDFPFDVTNGVITGTRSDTEEAEADYVFTVESGGSSEPLYVKVGASFSEPFISRQPSSVKVNCSDLSSGTPIVFSVEAVAHAGDDVTYKWQYNPGSGYIDFSTIRSMGIDSFEGETTPMLTMFAASNGDRVRCIVTAGETTITGNTVGIVVSHNYDSYQDVDSSYHKAVCSECGTVDKSEKLHKFKYVLQKEATESASGTYSRECTLCGYKTEKCAYTLEQVTGTARMVLVMDKEGTVTRSSQVRRYKNATPNSGSYPVRDGYTFAGWALDSNAKTPDYYPDEDVFVTDEDVVLYAVWTENTITVSGTSVKESNENDVLNDGGTVSYMPQTYREYSKITLNNATIYSWPIVGKDKEYGIYSTGDLYIELIGDNVINCETAGSIAIFSEGNVKIGGSGTLRIKGGKNIVYARAISARNIECGAGNIYISDCMTAFDGDTTLTDGTTEIYAGNYSGSGFNAFVRGFTLDAGYDVRAIRSTDGTSAAQSVSPDSSDINMAKYILIAPDDIKCIHYNAERKSVIPLCGETGIIYCANYDENGNLIKLERQLADTDTEYFMPEDFEMTPGSRIMLWDRNGNMKPLCEAVTEE